MEFSFENNSEKQVELSGKDVKKIVETVLKFCGKNTKEAWEINCVLVSKDEIREINRDYRDIDRATDIISFAYQEGEGAEFTPFSLGDLIISPEIVSKHAKKYGVTEKQEMTFVIVHGVLHLLGHDHTQESARKTMREQEVEIMKKLGFADFSGEI